jgi:hypothetical protein
MPSAQYREREPKDVKQEEQQDGELVTTGRDGKKYSGAKRGPKFKDEDQEAKALEKKKYWEDVNKKQKEKAESIAQNKLNEARAKRKKVFLIRAFVRFEGDVAKARDNLKKDERQWAGWEADEVLLDWIENITGNAKDIIEEHILLTRYEASLMNNAQGNASSKILLPAINKHRYNTQVQAQETANEGMADALKKVASRPMTNVQMLNILMPGSAENVGLPKEIKVPTLDEALKVSKKEKVAVIEDAEVVEE